MTALGSAAWCLAFALLILAVLMLDEYVTRLENKGPRR
jgi:hypothetical protein